MEETRTIDRARSLLPLLVTAAILCAAAAIWAATAFAAGTTGSTGTTSDEPAAVFVQDDDSAAAEDCPERAGSDDGTEDDGTQDDATSSAL